MLPDNFDALNAFFRDAVINILLELYNSGGQKSENEEGTLHS